MPPQSATFRPGASGDDGGCEHDGSDFDNSGFTHHFGSPGGDSYRVFVRFPNVTIPNSATIVSAFLRINSGSTQSTSGVNVDIRAQDENDPSAPADGNAVINATLGSEIVSWNGIESWTDGTQYDSPDIADVIQEIIVLKYIKRIINHIMVK